MIYEPEKIDKLQPYEGMSLFKTSAQMRNEKLAKERSRVVGG
jgi:hypothetical protein